MIYRKDQTKEFMKNMDAVKPKCQHYTSFYIVKDVATKICHDCGARWKSKLKWKKVGVLDENV